MSSKLSLSVVIPVYNEAKRLKKTFFALEDFAGANLFSEIEVIFVDDGSVDESAKIIKGFQLPCETRLISYPKNRGKGFAVRQGMLAARHGYALLTDVDISTPFSEIKKFGKFMESACPVIIGSRKMPGAEVKKPQSWHRRKMGEVYTLLANLMTGVRVSDFTCGFKCFSKEAREKIFPYSKVERWSYDAEILYLARKNNLKICEVGVIWENDEDTRVKLGKDTIQSFLDLVKIRFHG